MEKNYIDKLNRLLSTYQVHYQNLRSLHWNIKGENFFELHAKYEEQYTRTQVIIDDLAERILSLGETPLYSFEAYLAHSAIQSNPLIEQGKKGVEYIAEAQSKLLELERELLDLSASGDDEGTNSMMSDLIREKEKTSWMFKAWLAQR